MYMYRMLDKTVSLQRCINGVKVFCARRLGEDSASTNEETGGTNDSTEGGTGRKNGSWGSGTRWAGTCCISR